MSDQITRNGADAARVRKSVQDGPPYIVGSGSENSLVTVEVLQGAPRELAIDPAALIVRPEQANSIRGAEWAHVPPPDAPANQAPFDELRWVEEDLIGPGLGA
jgi:hypothetical protein